MNTNNPDRKPTGIFPGEPSMAKHEHLSPEKLYPPRLAAQIDHFISDLESANEKKPDFTKRDPRNYAFLRNFFPRLFIERNTRTYDVESTDYQEAATLANKQFPVKTYWNLCMDGRVLSVLTNGASSGIGSSTRVPGAMHREFVRGQDGEIFLREESTFANFLSNGLRKEPSGIIAEVFDSHIGCAARKAEENQAGKLPEDSGLMADVISKKEMADATETYVQRKFGDQKKVITIQTSFDPHDGSMLMGLETAHALALAAGFARGKAEREGSDPKKVKPEYTEEVLQHLVDDGGILSTKNIANDIEVKAVFEKYGDFTFDWRHNYIESAQGFWHGIQGMRDSLLPRINKAVKSLYPNADEIEIEERSILLLTSAFSYHLNNRDGYSYDEHREQFVKIYEGGQPPYDMSAFVLNTHMKDLPANIELAAGLVRSNRLKERVIDGSGNFTDPKEFSEAVVPIVMQEIVRQDISEEEWGKLAAVDWYDEQLPLPENWDRMSDDDFEEFLENKGVENLGVARGINNLRKRMAILYDPDLPTASRLIEQYKMALPTISGQNRRNYFVVPFVKTGFVE